MVELRDRKLAGKTRLNARGASPSRHPSSSNPFCMADWAVVEVTALRARRPPTAGFQIRKLCNRNPDPRLEPRGLNEASPLDAVRPDAPPMEFPYGDMRELVAEDLL